MVLLLCTSSDDALFLYKVSRKYLKKISHAVSGLWPGHEKLMDRQTDKQGDYYRASADFVWRGPNESLLGPHARELVLSCSCSINSTMFGKLLTTSFQAVQIKTRKSTKTGVLAII